jgi:molecular chaperone DnaJ
MLRLSGRGEASPGGMAGDLYIKVHVSKHPIWRREDYNLISDLKLKLTEALLGAEKKLESLDGEIILKVPTGSNQGDILRVRGKGVPMRGGKRGDLLIRLQVAMPNSLSRQEKKIIEELRDAGL